MSESCILLRADISIADVRVMSVGVDVSIAVGILMFIWGKLSTNVSESFVSPGH